ncbi:transcriptional repressor TCF25-domain-containing protein [Gymnopilus junonius]|uniref:Transcriptional repressor TCF25-domain-containing protein n=1 Tax=Gymnopilus junonius TaxID=109634 RepID=A0A9P5TGE8_GYMJU|nr:transcriptional repressor TCF25-domain-containing protein [Gymnopilus junonius]
MPPRLNKRQQRELEELEALKSSEVLNSPSDEELEAGPSDRRNGGAGGVFMNGNAVLTAEESEEEEEQAVKSKKVRLSVKEEKKKAVEPTTNAPPHPPKPVREPPKSTPVHSTVKNEKKAQKKARQKEKKAANDELDQALAELSIQYPVSQKITQAASGKSSLADLLSVSLQHLDGEAEMRRFFGSRVVQASRAEGSASSKRKVPNVKSNLTRFQPTWWAAKGREGLSLRALSDEEVGAKVERHHWMPMQEKWWTVEYSKKYTSITKAFMGTVLSGDPQGFWDLLGTLPWHADTLLQISEVYRHREGRNAQAVDFIDRALFTYERAFMGAFTFTTGLNRLDFDRVENRPFFLALHRQVTGCVRTAFEFARLLYSIDPWTDPHGAAFHLDFVAIKSGMHEWLLDMYDVFEDRLAKNGGQLQNRLIPSLLPGWAYARALALRISEDARKEEDHTASSEALKEAARDFPSIVPLLADKLDVPIPANVRAHKDFKIMTDRYYLSDSMGILHILSHLYVQRSSPIWKDHSAWFSSTITSAFPSTLPSTLPTTGRRKSFLNQYENPHLRYSVYRHIMVLETSYRHLFSFIPKQVLEAKSLACDPLPPLTKISEYDDEFFKSVEDAFSSRSRTRRQRAVDERRLAQMIPDAAFRQQLQGFFDANPHFQERFPGGILQFAQMMGQLPPDVLEDLLVVEAANVAAAGGGGGGGMPGAFGEEDFVIDDEQLAAVPPVPMFAPFAQPMVGAFVDDEEDEGEEDDEDEDEDEEDISVSFLLL